MLLHSGKSFFRVPRMDQSIPTPFCDCCRAELKAPQEGSPTCVDSLSLPLPCLVAFSIYKTDALIASPHGECLGKEETNKSPISSSPRHTYTSNFTFVTYKVVLFEVFIVRHLGWFAGSGFGSFVECKSWVPRHTAMHIQKLGCRR